MKKISPVIVTLILLLFTSINYDNKIFTPHFVDEEDNIVLGTYLLKGEKLYKDLFSHHQPLAYIISAGIQKNTKPNSIFLLIKRHREFIIAWSFIWSLILVARFGLPLFLFVTIYELTKIFLFGNLFLSEPLGVYPLIYLVTILLTKKIIPKIELVVIGACLSIVGFLLSALWPLLILIFSVIMYRQQNRPESAGLILLGTLPICLLISFFISLPEYFSYAYFINFNYYIPVTNRDPWILNLFEAFAAPVLSFFSLVKDSQILLVIRLVSFLMIMNIIFLLRTRVVELSVLIFFILGLSNLRTGDIGLQYYSGFHTLPWFDLLILIAIFSSINIWKKYDQKLVKSLLISLGVMIFIFSINISQKELFKKRDINTDWYINYSRQFDFGQAVNIMKFPNDTLFVVPDEWLIYWQADINHATRMLNYYAWMSSVPELRNIIEDNFKQNPPTFFYCDCNGNYFGLEAYFNLYQPVIKDGKETKLLVLKEKFSSLSKEQKKQLNFFNILVQ